MPNTPLSRIRSRRRFWMVVLLVVAVVAVLGCAVLLLCIHVGPLKNYARYRGGLMFIGKGKGFFGVEYHTMSVWNAPARAGTRPEVVFHVDGNDYAMSSLTPSDLESMGCTKSTGPGYSLGGIRDASGVLLTFRIEHGQVHTAHLKRPSEPGSDYTAYPVTSSPLLASVGGGKPFTMPLSAAQVVACCGEPWETRWELAN